MTNGNSNRNNNNNNNIRNNNNNSSNNSSVSNDPSSYFSSKLTTNQPRTGFFRLAPESPASSDETNLHFSSSASSSTSSIENDYGELKKAVEAMVVAAPLASSSSSNTFSSKSLLKKNASSSSALSTLVLTTPTASRSTTTLPTNATKHTPISSNTSTPTSSVPSSPSYIVRKKSGERVKSSLKLPSLVRHQSMPTTSKMVHFDDNLERVCHFLNSEKPTAVSTQSSPTDERPKFHWGDSDHDTESSEDEEEEDPRIGFQRYIERTEWQISLPNYTQNLSLDNSKSVFVESIFLSGDKNNLIGNVAVKNLTFEKHVSIRYSLDNWKTVTEIAAEYNPDVRRKLKVLGYDRFTFSLNLCDFPQHYTKSVLFFCVKFNDGNGNTFWDNNNGQNYQVIFTRVNKVKPVQTNRLPVRSHVSGNSKAVNTHRRSKSSHDLVGTRGGYEEDDEIFSRLRKPKFKNNSSDQFTARYDFGSSFSSNKARTDNTGAQTSSWNANVPNTAAKPGEEFALNAKSYQELIDSYCFFQGANSKPVVPAAAKTCDNPAVENKPSSTSSSSTSSSSTPALHSHTPKTTTTPRPSISINSLSSAPTTKRSAAKNGTPSTNAVVGPKPLIKESRLTVV